MIRNKKTAWAFFRVMLCLTLILAGSLGSFINTSKAYAAKTDCTHIYDGLNLFNSTQVDELEELAKKYSDKTGINFLIITTTYDSGNYDSTSDPILYDTEDFSEMFYDDFVETYGSEYKDCVIFTINIVTPDDSSGRYADISGQGEGKIKMDNDRCTQLFEHLKSDLSVKNYYEASKEYLKRGARYVKISPGINPESFFLKLWFQLLAAFVVSLIIILIMASNSKGKMTVNGANYLDKDNSHVLGQYDRYIRTVTTKRKIESSSSSGGGGHSGGGGGGGGSHGGGHF